MLLHEYQAKDRLTEHDVACPRGAIADTLTHARAIAQLLRTKAYVVKAQVLAGEREAGGGILRASTPDGVETAAAMLLEQVLETPQTPDGGIQVSKVLVEEEVSVAHAAYTCLLIDPASGEIVLLGARETPQTRITSRRQFDTDFRCLRFFDPAQIARDDLAAFAHDIGFHNVSACADELAKICTAFVAMDARLMEFSPLAETADGRVLALDVKLSIDDNALFRQEVGRAPSGDGGETDAPRSTRTDDVNFVALDGEIGLVCNGAGLGLQTVDMVIAAGGRPANFMDIRTGATTKGVAAAIERVLAQPSVKALLVNIHGGGLTKCDAIAEALALALRHQPFNRPIIFRAAGNNAAFAETVLANCGVAVQIAPSITSAVDAAIKAVAGASADDETPAGGA